MKSISDFFSRIQGVYAKKIVLYTSTQETIKKITGIEIPLKDISFHGSILTIKGLDQAAKSFVFIKKGAILNELKQKLPNTVVGDVRT